MLLANIKVDDDRPVVCLDFERASRLFIVLTDIFLSSAQMNLWSLLMEPYSIQQYYVCREWA